MLRILAVGDEETLRDKPPELGQVDLLVNCGDLSPSYLDFLICKYQPSARVMVYGNHDKIFYHNENYEDQCYSEVYKGMYIINDSLHRVKKNGISGLSRDVLLCGYSGAMAYGKRPFFFNEKQAASFVRNLRVKDFFSSLDMDIMVSHCAPDIDGLIKNEDLFHKPSKSLGEIYGKFQPKLWFYGHIHPRSTNEQLDFLVNDEMYLLNVVPYKFVEFDEVTGESAVFPRI